MIFERKKTLTQCGLVIVHTIRTSFFEPESDHHHME